MDITKKALYTSILQELESILKLDLCLAGGAVRDLLHNKPTKDLDIEILNFDKLVGEFYHNDFISEYIDEVADLLQELGAEGVQTFNEYEGASLDAHVDFIIKFKWRGFDVDLILRDMHPETPRYLVSLYDMSLNQVTLYKGEVVTHVCVADNKVQGTGKMITRSRLNRMKEKYPEYDYSAVERFVYEGESVE